MKKVIFLREKIDFFWKKSETNGPCVNKWVAFLLD